MNYYEQIQTASGWLELAEWQLADRHLARAKASGIRYRHLPETLDFEPGTVSILRGPRQIGKSTECKFIVASGLARGRHPSQFVFFPCDNLMRRQEIAEVVRVAVALTSPRPDKPLTLFLDEITGIKEWYKTVKWLVDTNALAHTALVLTGSSAQEIKRGYDRMPGRREGGQDLCLLPMSFRDFARVAGDMELPALSLWDALVSEDAFLQFRTQFMGRATALRDLLRRYLRFGGFPKVVADVKARGRMEEATGEMLLAVVSSEIEKQRRSTATLRMLLQALYATLPNPISLHRIAASQNIPSVPTVKDYLEILHASFVTFPVAQLDMSKRVAFPRKNRKYYFTDPAFLEAIRAAFSLRDLGEECLAESAVAVALIRRFAGEWARWGHVDDLHYWRSSTGREVDFVIEHDRRFHGIEVKYQTAVSGWDELSIAKGIGRGLLVTRDAFELAAIPRIPVWAFLSLQL
jgi:predicted AAA+ superfamily ATPase